MEKENNLPAFPNHNFNDNDDDEECKTIHEVIRELLDKNEKLEQKVHNLEKLVENLINEIKKR